MKILQLVTKRQFRGAEVFAADLSAELIKLGHQIIFVGLYINDDDVLTVDNALNLDIAEESSGFLSLRLVRKLARVVNKEKPDIIQCNGSDTLKYMVVASYLCRRTPIVYRNISMISEWVNSRPKKIFYKLLFKKVSHVSSVGGEALEDFIYTFNYERSKTSVIRRGIPVKELKGSNFGASLKKELGLGEEDHVVMHIGNFSPEKNHQFLFEVFLKIKIKNPLVKLVCVGNGKLFNFYQQEIENQDLRDTIFFLGFRRDIPELLAASDCLVLSSIVEGVPGVILEAAGQKKPSLAVNVGGVSEVLIDNKTGFLISGFNHDLFIDRLLKLVLDKKINNHFGENAYQLVKEKFNPSLNALKFENLYDQLK